VRNASRRRFLQASGGLLLAVGLPARGQEESLFLHRGFTANAFVRVASDNTVTVIVKHLEMGQGTYTGLPTLVAEELDADWSQVRVESAPADAAKYNNLLWGPAQGTGGSTALANSWEQMRKAGAAARAMLVAAAAEKWKAPAGEIRVSKGVV
jgi:isoquinoline 1-oxidoreductase beta subunit